MIGNILDNTTELYMIKYTFGEIFSSSGATLYKNTSDQTVESENNLPLIGVSQLALINSKSDCNFSGFLDFNKFLFLYCKAFKDQIFKA